MPAARKCTKCGTSITKLAKNRKRCLDCSPPRTKQSEPEPRQDTVASAFDRAVEANRVVEDQDQALVAVGRKIAEQIDYASEFLTGQELTKALYLTPHLVNVLKEMLATPAARKDLKSASEGKGGKLGRLSAVPKPA